MLDNLMHFLHGLRVSIKSLFCQKLPKFTLYQFHISLFATNHYSFRQTLLVKTRSMNDNEGQNFINSKSDQFLYNFSKYRTKNFRRKETFHCFGVIFFFWGGYKIIFHSAKLMWCILYITTIRITMILFKRNM